MKKYLPILPDCIFIAGFSIVLLSTWILGSWHISQLIILIPTILLLIKVLFKAKWIGIILGSLLALGSYYMLCAVVSEYREFPTATFEAVRLLLIGLLIFGATLILSIWLTIRSILP